VFVHVFQSVFSNNTAVEYGGGINIDPTTCHTYLDSIHLLHNNADTSGGGIRARARTALNNSVLRSNSALRRGTAYHMYTKLRIRFTMVI
jgi:hypothetical protein